MELINKGTYILNPDAHQGTLERTVVVVGVARSGTSMVGRALHELGLYMGEKSHPPTFEDVEISDLLEVNYNENALKKLIQHRNQAHTIWGWKRPGAFHYAQKFVSKLRNPCFVVTFRDYLAIALRNQIAVKTEVLQNLQRTHSAEYGELLKFISGTPYPCLLMSYEKMIQNPKVLLQSLVSFTGIAPSEKQWQNALQSVQPNHREYIHQARLQPTAPRAHKLYNGRLDNFRNGKVNGWVKKQGTEQPVEVDILMNGKKITTVRADGFRADLAQQKIGQGRHAFLADLSQLTNLETDVKIRAVVSGTDYELNNSPLPSAKED